MIDQDKKFDDMFIQIYSVDKAFKRITDALIENYAAINSKG